MGGWAAHLCYVNGVLVCVCLGCLSGLSWAGLEMDELRRYWGLALASAACWPLLVAVLVESFGCLRLQSPLWQHQFLESKMMAPHTTLIRRNLTCTSLLIHSHSHIHIHPFP